MKSNVKLRSNVYVRLAGLVQDDPKYRAEIRGIEALRELLTKIAFFTPDGASHWLTAAQSEEWDEVSRCALCKTQVIGPVRNGRRVTRQFRCPHGDCPAER